jgi:hypothetical protein
MPLSGVGVSPAAIRVQPARERLSATNLMALDPMSRPISGAGMGHENRITALHYRKADAKIVVARGSMANPAAS